MTADRAVLRLRRVLTWHAHLVLLSAFKVTGVDIPLSLCSFRNTSWCLELPAMKLYSPWITPKKFRPTWFWVIDLTSTGFKQLEHQRTQSAVSFTPLILACKPLGLRILCLMFCQLFYSHMVQTRSLILLNYYQLFFCYAQVHVYMLWHPFTKDVH